MDKFFNNMIGNSEDITPVNTNKKIPNFYSQQKMRAAASEAGMSVRSSQPRSYTLTHNKEI